MGTPCHFARHARGFRALRHRVDDPREAFVAGEQRGAGLEDVLVTKLGENLDAAVVSAASDIRSCGPSSVEFVQTRMQTSVNLPATSICTWLGVPQPGCRSAP